MEYWEVSYENLPYLSAKLSMSTRTLVNLLKEAETKQCACVFFKRDGEWKQIFVHLTYSVEQILDHILDRVP